MKTLQSILFVLLLMLFFSSCTTINQAEATPWAESMKGYELYSWPEGDHWVFSLLAGTNREKTLEEIRSSSTILPDLNALKFVLKKIPSGQYITWSSREALSFPPEDILKQVEQACQDQGLILYIAR